MALTLYFMAMAALSLLQHLVVPVLAMCAVIWPVVVFLEVRDWRAAANTGRARRVRKPRAAASRARPARPHLRHRWV